MLEELFAQGWEIASTGDFTRNPGIELATWMFKKNSTSINNPEISAIVFHDGARMEVVGSNDSEQILEVLKAAIEKVGEEFEQPSPADNKEKDEAVKKDEKEEPKEEPKEEQKPESNEEADDNNDEKPKEVEGEKKDGEEEEGEKKDGEGEGENKPDEQKEEKKEEEKPEPQEPEESEETTEIQVKNPKSFDMSLDTFDATHIALTISDGDPGSIQAAHRLAALLQWESMTEVRPRPQ